MIQLRQIVKDSDNQIGMEDPKCVKYTFISFDHLDWMIISVIVTIYSTVLIQRYQDTGHFIMLTTKLLRSRSIYNYEHRKFGPAAATLGGGFFVGILIWYALKKLIKLAAVIAGLFLAGLAYLQSQQIANINWNKLQTMSEDSLKTFHIWHLQTWILIRTVHPYTPNH